jgi:hypothetical protein
VSKFGRPHLVDTNKGDRAYLLEFQSSADSQTRSVVRAFAPAAFTQLDGLEATLEGAFVEPPTRMVSIGWDVAAFEAARAAGEPSPPRPNMVSLVAAPSGGLDCVLSTFLSNTFFESTSSITVPLANPFPSDWPVMVMAQPAYGLVTLVPLDTLTGPVGPLVSAPLDLSASAGPTPTVSFSPPSIGSPDAYVIEVVEAGVPGIEGGVDLVANIVTSATSFTLPSGLLRPSGRYGFNVRARKGGSAAAPYRWWRTTGYGEARSATRLLNP